MLKITSCSASDFVGKCEIMNRNNKIKLNLQHFAKAGTTVQADFALVKAREIDFVTRFTKNWDALRTILGIMRPIRKAAGTTLISYKTVMKSDSLQGGASVGEGEDIPYTEFGVVPVKYGDIQIEKYAKAVTIEAVAKYGADIAVSKTDDEFLNQLQGNVLSRFYSFLNTGALVAAEKSFQMALAMAKGMVVDKFNKMRRTATEIVGFANVLDVYEYVGTANITIQTQFGFQYVKDFMGYSTLFLLSEPDIPRGRVIALPVENIDLYYIDPSDSEFARLGLRYTVQGETNLIGFHSEGKYGNATGESFALMGMTLWAEYIDGISVVDMIDASVADLTVAADTSADYFGSGKGASDIQSNINVAGGKVTGTLKFIEGGIAAGTLSGDGYFLGLKFDNFASGLTYNNVQVGLVNSSTGMGLQTLDADKNAVFKISDKETQKIKIVQTTADGKRNIQYLDLSGLTLETTGA